MVFVLDTNKCPLAPCHEAVARKKCYSSRQKGVVAVHAQT